MCVRQKDSRFFVVHFKTDEASVTLRLIAFPCQSYVVTPSAIANEIQNFMFTWKTDKIEHLQIQPIHHHVLSNQPALV